MPTLGQPVFSGGKLYVTQAAVSGGQAQILQIDPTNGTILKTVISPSPSGLICAEYLAADPISGDLFTDNVGCGCSSAIWRISNLGGMSPSLSTYANMPGCPNYALSFSPGGTLYVEGDGPATLLQVSGTGVSPTTVSGVYSVPNGSVGSASPGLGLLAAGGAGADAQFLIFNQPNQSGANSQTSLIDLNSNPPSTASILTTDSALGPRHLVLGPDGCLYGAGGTAVYKITDSTGACTYTTQTQPLTLVLNPPGIAPNPAQGSSVTLHASFHCGNVPDGTPVVLNISGANAQRLQTGTVKGAASFTYTGLREGVDNLTAFALANNTGQASNTAVVTFAPGAHSPFLTLNGTHPTSLFGAPINLSANLSDRSIDPIAPILGRLVKFSAGGENCSASTDASGNAGCQIGPLFPGTVKVTASFAGDFQYASAEGSKGLTIVTPPPVTGRLRIAPVRLNFGRVALTSARSLTITVTNLGQVTRKNHPAPIIIELEQIAKQPSPFGVAMECPADDPLGPRSKGVKPGTCMVHVTFMPTTTGRQTGVLEIYDNRQTKKPSTNLMQTVPLVGIGKAPKKIIRRKKHRPWGDRLHQIARGRIPILLIEVHNAQRRITSSRLRSE